jgi:hypothetical protein
VFQYCEKNQILNPFSQGKAGREWIDGFLKRHTDLTVRKPENVSIGRAYGFSRHKVRDFFQKYLGLLYDDNGNRVIPNSHIYNADESGFTIVHRPEKILAQKGKRSVGILTSAEKGKTVTFLGAFSAVGHYIPPLFIFPRMRMRPELLEKAPEGSIGAANPTGWVNTEIFEQWFDHFLTTVQPKSRAQPTLLLFDGQKSHTRNVRLIDKARDNNVVLLSFPSHSTHKLQPLDRTFFKSLKNNYSTEVHRWLRDHRGIGLSQNNIPQLVSSAYTKSATMENAVNGFRVAGLVPPNENIFTDEEFAASDRFIREQQQQGVDGSDEPIPMEEQNRRVVLATPNPQAVQNAPVVETLQNPQTVQTTDVPAERPAQTTDTPAPENSPDVFHTQNPPIPVNQIPAPTVSAKGNQLQQDVTFGNNEPRLQHLFTSQAVEVNFADLMSPPSKRPAKRKRRTETSEIISSSPYKRKLLHEITQSQQKERTTNAQGKRKHQKKRISLLIQVMDSQKAETYGKVL